MIPQLEGTTKFTYINENYTIYSSNFDKLALLIYQPPGSHEKQENQLGFVQIVVMIVQFNYLGVDLFIKG